LTENSVRLTGCNRLTCKGDGKLFQHVDQVNPTSSDDDDRIFRNQRNFPTVNLTSFDDSDGIFRNQRSFPTFSVLTRRSFPTVFRQFSVSFPTKNQNQITSPGPGANLRPLGLQSATLPLRHTHFMSSMFCQQYLCHCQSKSYFVSNVLIVFTFASAVFSFASILFTFVSTVFFFISTLFTFVSTVFFFVSIVFFFVSLPPSRLSFFSSVLC
jgi:hypothetical protein